MTSVLSELTGAVGSALGQLSALGSRPPGDADALMRAATILDHAATDVSSVGSRIAEVPDTILFVCPAADRFRANASHSGGASCSASSAFTHAASLARRDAHRLSEAQSSYDHNRRALEHTIESLRSAIAGAK